MIKRWWQNHGFGIESRTDYAFLHDVIRENLPYYAYEDIERSNPLASDKELRILKLIFRVKNYFHGGNVTVVDADTTLPHYHGYNAIIVRGNLSTSDLWQDILNQKSITYDMVTLGIAIFDADRYPEHYKILEP